MLGVLLLLAVLLFVMLLFPLCFSDTNLHFNGATYDGTAKSFPYFTKILPWIHAGAIPSVTLKDIDGDTAEDFAQQNNHEEVAQYLSNYKKN